MRPMEALKPNRSIVKRKLDAFRKNIKSSVKRVCKLIEKELEKHPSQKPSDETVGPSDNTGVKGTVRNDKAMKEKFSELLVLAFPDERLQGSL